MFILCPCALFLFFVNIKLWGRPKGFALRRGFSPHYTDNKKPYFYAEYMRISSHWG